MPYISPASSTAFFISIVLMAVSNSSLSALYQLVLCSDQYAGNFATDIGSASEPSLVNAQKESTKGASGGNKVMSQAFDEVAVFPLDSRRSAGH